MDVGGWMGGDGFGTRLTSGDGRSPAASRRLKSASRALVRNRLNRRNIRPKRRRGSEACGASLGGRRGAETVETVWPRLWGRDCMAETVETVDCYGRDCGAETVGPRL